MSEVPLYCNISGQACVFLAWKLRSMVERVAAALKRQHLRERAREKARERGKRDIGKIEREIGSLASLVWSALSYVSPGRGHLHVQGYLAHKKAPPPRTLQQVYA